MTPKDIVAQASKFGMTLGIKAGKLTGTCADASKLPESLTKLIQAYKEELCEYLGGKPKPAQSTQTQLQLWLVSFLASERIGVVTFDGQEIEVRKEANRLGADKRFYHETPGHDEWLRECAALRVAVEYGRPVSWPEGEDHDWRKDLEQQKRLATSGAGSRTETKTDVDRPAVGQDQPVAANLFDDGPIGETIDAAIPESCNEGSASGN